VLSSFLRSDFNDAMSEAIQAIEDMVFNSAAARTIYWAIFDDLVNSGELFRQKLVSLLLISVTKLLLQFRSKGLLFLVKSLDTNRYNMQDPDDSEMPPAAAVKPASSSRGVLQDKPIINLNRNKLVKRQSTNTMKKKPIYA